MQLALFDIRADEAAPKGKTGKAAANGKTKAIQNPGDDFRSSLRMVSKRNRENFGDVSPERAGAGQTTGDEHFIRLGDILNEIMREWPAGKRPVGLQGAGGESADAQTPDFGVVENRSRETAPTDGAITIHVAGKGRQAKTRIRQETAGFTIALIQRSGGVQKAGRTHLATGNEVGAAAGSVNLKTTRAGKAGQPQSSPGKGSGITILNMAAARLSGAESRTVESAAARESQKGENRVEKSTARQTDTSLKTGRSRTGARMLSLKSTGESIAPSTGTKAAAGRKSKIMRPVMAQSRSIGDGSDGKAASPKDVSTEAKLSGDPRISAGAVKPVVTASGSQTGPAGTPAGLKPEGGPKSPEQGRSAGKTAAGNGAATDRNTVSGSETGVRTAGAVQAPGGENSLARKSRFKSKVADSGKVSESPERDGLRPVTALAAEKSTAGVAKRGQLKPDTNPVDKEQFSNDSAVGQVVREQKGVEQHRFEAADSNRVKPVDTAQLPPKSQPVVSTAATPELEKPVLDRLTQTRVLEQITAKMRLHPKKGGNEIRIQLKPETLGQVQLKVLAHDHNVTVKMVAETATARDIIENNIGQLRADLHALGLNVEKLGVDVFTTNDFGDRQPAQQHGGQTGNRDGGAYHGFRDDDLSDRVRQMHAAEDEAGGGALIGIFA